jgi:hypothetical protein
MQGTHYSSAFLDTVVKRKDIMEKAGQEFTGNLLLKMIVVELEEWSKEDLFALYTEFECPVVTHKDMDDRNFDRYDSPISLMQFAIGLQVEQLVNPEPETSVAYDQTISYIRQTLDDLATYVQRRIESHVAPEREQEALLDLIEEMYTVRNNAEEVLG